MRGRFGLSLLLCLVAGGSSLAFLTACPKNTGGTTSSTVELTAVLDGVVKGGQGSGVVGGPVDGVEITATSNGKTLGPVKSDSSGSFTLDARELLAPGTGTTQEALKGVTPVTVDLKFTRQGFKTQVEVVTVPYPKSQDMTFYLSGE